MTWLTAWRASLVRMIFLQAAAENWIKQSLRYAVSSRKQLMQCIREVTTEQIFLLPSTLRRTPSSSPIVLLGGRFFRPGRDGNPASLDANCFFILMLFFLQRTFSYLPAPCWVFLTLLWMGASGPIKAEPPFRLFCIIFQMTPFVFSSNHFIAGNLPL